MLKVIIIHNGLEVYRDYLGQLIRDLVANNNPVSFNSTLSKAFYLINKGEYTLDFHYSSKDDTKGSVFLTVTIAD